MVVTRSDWEFALFELPAEARVKYCRATYRLGEKHDVALCYTSPEVAIDIMSRVFAQEIDDRPVAELFDEELPLTVLGSWLRTYIALVAPLLGTIEILGAICAWTPPPTGKKEPVLNFLGVLTREGERERVFYQHVDDIGHLNQNAIVVGGSEERSVSLLAQMIIGQY